MFDARPSVVELIPIMDARVSRPNHKRVHFFESSKTKFIRPLIYLRMISIVRYHRNPSNRRKIADDTRSSRVYDVQLSRKLETFRYRERRGMEILWPSFERRSIAARKASKLKCIKVRQRRNAESREERPSHVRVINLDRVTILDCGGCNTKLAALS